MQIGIISDVHSNLHALTAVLHELDAHQVDLILCAGDILCYGADPNGVIALLRQRGIPVVTGNYDDAVAWGRLAAARKPSSSGTEHLKRAALSWTQAQVSPQHRHYLRGLPWSLNYRFDGVRVMMMHAGIDYLDAWIHPDDPENMALLASQVQADVLILGHTHYAYTYSCEGLLFINPGAVGRALDGDTRASFATLDTANQQVEFHRVTYDIDAAVRDIETSGIPLEIAALVRHGARRLEEIPQ
jgi:putative phosphoesterase